ncbi:ribonuclease H-like domain-containing protein [Tanacetum coccineum]
MITQSQSFIGKPIDRFSLNNFLISFILKNPSDALKDFQYHNAMYDEYNALVKNGTWLLVPRPAGVNMICSMWLCKHKFHADGTLSHYKARLWPIHQLDVKNAFFNGDLSETVYMHQPPSFVDARLCHTGRNYHSRCNSSLFIYRQGSQVVYLLLYMDDIILTASSTTLLQHLIDSLHREFDMTDLAVLNYFIDISVVRHSTSLFSSQRKYVLRLLERAHMVNCNLSRTPVDTESKLGPDGVPVQDPTLYRSLAGGLQYLTFTRPDLSYAGTLDLGLHLYASSTTSLVGYIDTDWAGFPSTRRSTSGLFLSQRKYALQLLERAHMVNYNPSRTPVDTESKLGPDGVPVQDLTLYRILAGGLQYLTFTRPDLSYAVQQICLYMHDPREPHLAALKRILRYVQGTLDLGLHLYASSTTSLVGYTDVDWAGCPSTRRSTSAETAWLRNLLRELHSPLSTAILVYCDNVSAVYMSVNPVQHQRTKHIEIDIHFVRDMVTAGQVRVLHVPSRFQYADIFTKGLPSTLFEEFRSSLSVRPISAPTAGAY